MNKDINRTLMAFVPILRMNGEMVKSIEAVNDWYKARGREYLKVVAEIIYDNGVRKYADINCDSNLTAVYDVVAVIQQIKPCSIAIERIERGAYRQYPIESIPAADVKQVRWIPVEERMPETDKLVLVVRSDGDMSVAGWNAALGWLHYWSGFRVRNVTHWMPLPTPPEEANADD